MSENEDILIKKSLKYSVLDGFFYSIKLGFGESFFLAYLTFFKASNIELGLAGSLPQALGSLSQLFSGFFLKVFKSRKITVCINVLFENLMFIPMILTFFMGNFKAVYFIIFLSLYWIFGMILGPSWSSWMGDLVHENMKGKYFGARNRLNGFAAFFSFVIAGLILYFFNNTDNQYIGYVIIFIIAFISRFISLIFLTKKYEPKYQYKIESRLNIKDFISNAKITNFGILSLYICLMNFSVMMSSSFFTPYMLKDLKFSYLIYTIVLASSMVFKNIFMPLWGRIIDKYGTKIILSITGFLLPIIPVLWLLSDKVIFIILFQIYSGIVWAGFELSSFNFIFDATTSKNRINCISVHNIFNGLSILLGGIIGGLIVKFNDIFWSKYLFIFLVSGILRLIVSIIFVPRLKEVREVEKISYKDLFLRIISTMVTKGVIYNPILFRKRNKHKL